MGLDDDGVVASMRLNTDTDVPDNVTATVKSVSAVGEQYIDLVPPKDPSTNLLRDGANIGLDRTAVGQDIAALLTQAESLVNSIGDARVQDLLRETFKAFNGSGPELARMIQSSRLLIDEANDNYGQITQLIDQAGPFLDAQIRSGDDIKSLADGLARFTTEAAEGRSAAAVGAADRARRRAGGEHHLRRHPPELPDAGRQPGQFRPHRRHLPQVDRAGAGDLPRADGRVDHGRRRSARRRGRQARLQGRPRRPAAVLDGLHPAAVDPVTRATPRCAICPTDLYCKTAQNDPAVVRGARNYPCQEFPGKRAPTIQLCRDPRGYVPIGSNPWRGPPVPYDTPVTNGRNITPPNKFPNIPPGADYDPGPPVVQLPPGVPPGPGPAPNAPFPLPVPPSDPRAAATAAAVLRAARPDRAAVRQDASRGARPPAALRAARASTRSGAAASAEARRRRRAVRPRPRTIRGPACSSTPQGERASTPMAWTRSSPAETWVDLMLDPRQA